MLQIVVCSVLFIARRQNSVTCLHFSSSYSVAAALESKCTVQVAPFSKGGAALDSRYGLECIKFLLSTTNLSPTRYDAVIFNFGMHDIDFSNLFPEVIAAVSFSLAVISFT